ncbi:MAG: adenylate/guanylate cyclase [Betaproteobacteria bacterium]|nr:adenylate/guanylate cyclase [Betaproteobacteria bacterium]
MSSFPPEVTVLRDGIAAERASYAPAHVQRWARDTEAPFRASCPATLEAAVLFADISGFTPLSSKLAGRGAAGTEALSRLLNDYFGRLLAIVAFHGGEPLKFAGDALIALWPADESGGRLALQRAAGCALAIQRELHGYDAGAGDTLSLRIAVAHGRVNAAQLHSGDSWHFVVGGVPVNDLAQAQACAQPGHVVLTAGAWSVLESRAEAVSAGEGCWRLFDVEPAPPAPRAELDWTSDALAKLEGFVPGPVRARLAAGHRDWLGELRQVTSLFAQVPDFDHTAPDAASRLQSVLERTCPIVRRYDAFLKELVIDDKGVVLVIVFGLPPGSHEDDTARGVRAALELVDALDGAAIGLTTGRCFCGVVGSDVRREYAVVGDVMNVAARLMEAAAQMQVGHRILCDAATRDNALARVEFADLPAMSLKGKAAPVAVARPVRLRDAPLRKERSIVGRAHERAAIARAIERCARREPPGTLLLVADAGMGKSCLVEELERLAAGAGVGVIHGAADAIEAGTPFFAWRRVFASLLGISDMRQGEARRLQAAIALGPEFVAHAPLLEAVLALGFAETAQTAELSGAMRANATCELLVAALEKAALARPTCVVLEDAHWFDASSWSLALEVSRRVAALELVITTRPVPDPAPVELQALQDSPACTTLRLAPLSAEETVALVCSRLGAASLAPEVDEAIRSRASGHPFFAEELGFALRDADVVEVVDGICVVARGVDASALEYPETVQGAVTARIDRLGPQAQLAIKVASVIGAAFPVSVLRDVHPVPADLATLDAALESLLRADLTVLDSPGPERAYSFKHVITREVAYNLMLFSQRRQLHHGVAKWHERAHGDERPEMYAVLAHHWARAGIVPKAVGYLEKSSTRTFSMGLGKASVEQGLEALSLLGVVLPKASANIVPLIGAELGRIQAQLKGRAPRELLEHAPLADETVGAVIGVLLRTMPFAHQSLQAELFALMALRCMTLTLEHGNGPAAPVVYAMHSIVYRAVTGDTRTACEFAELALALDARNGKTLLGPASFIYTWFNQHWLYPLARAFDMSLEAADRAFELGDVLYGCFNLSAHVVQLATAGRPLAEVIEVARTHLSKNGRRVINAAFHCVHELQFAKALAGLTEDPLSLSDAEHDETRDIASICASDHYNQIGFYFISKLRLHYYSRDYAAALEFAGKAQALLPAFAGQTGEFELSFFHGLALLARAREVQDDARKALVDSARERLQQLRGWATLCAANFEHKALLVEAELGVTEGLTAQAMLPYGAAAKSAAAAGYVQHEALAHELRAGALGEAGDNGWNEAYAQAREAYTRWGAKARVADLDRRFEA